MTLAVPRRTNVPRPTRKDPKDTPDRAFNKLAWGNHYWTEGVHGFSTTMLRLSGFLNKLTNHYFINIALFKEVLDYIASYHVLTPSDVILEHPLRGISNNFKWPAGAICCGFPQKASFKANLLNFKSALQGSRAGMSFEIFDPLLNHTRFDIGSNLFDNIKLLSQWMPTATV